MFAQFDTSLSGELRVKPENVDCKLHLVDDSLSVRLTDSPQLKVLRAIIGALTIFVMHRLAFLQLTTEHFFHHMSMKKLLAAPAQMKTNVASRMLVSIRVDRAPLAAIVSTISRAKPLFHVVTGVAAIFGSAQLAVASFAAEFTLKCRHWLFVHEEQLAEWNQGVKEVF